MDLGPSHCTPAWCPASCLILNPQAVPEVGLEPARDGLWGLGLHLKDCEAKSCLWLGCGVGISS